MLDGTGTVAQEKRQKQVENVQASVPSDEEESFRSWT